MTSQTTDKRAKGLLAVICAATFFGVLNASAVNVVLPEIGTDYGAEPGLLGWVMSIFLLTYGVAIPFYGRLADHYGARRLFIIGLTLFGIGSALCAAALDLYTLLGARVVQGIGGAAFPGIGMTLASRAFPADQRGTALGFIAATMGVGAAVGPLIGGVAADLVSWRLLFAVSALSILVIPLASALLPGRQPGDTAGADASMDLWGGILLGATVAAALYTVSQASRSGWTAPVVATAILGLAAAITLVVHQRRVAEPFIPRVLLRNSAYRRAVIMAFCTTGSYLAALIGLPLLLTRFNGLSPSDIGLVLLPEALLTAVVGIVAGRLVDRFGPGVPTFVGGLTMVAVSVGFATVAGGSVITIAILGGFLGAGYALLNTPIAAAITSIVDSTVLASALSLNAMVFFVGGSFGTTAFATLIETRSGAASSFNPLYDGPAVAFADAFAVFAIPMLLVTVLALSLPRNADPVEEPRETLSPTTTPITDLATKSL